MSDNRPQWRIVSYCIDPVTHKAQMQSRNATTLAQAAEIKIKEQQRAGRSRVEVLRVVETWERSDGIMIEHNGVRYEIGERR